MSNQEGDHKDRGVSYQEEARIGVYICHCGGNISDVVDVAKVAEEAKKLPQVTVARTNTFMCSDPGQAMILKDIQKEGLNRIVVASCSPKLHEMTFRSVLERAGLNHYLYEHANIREQVSWVHHAHPKEATEKAIRLVAAAVAKASRLDPLEPIHVEAQDHALVIGAGVSGMKAALDLAHKGVRVTLLERESYLGGQAAQLDRVYPTEEKAEELILELASAVVRHPNIRLLTRAEVREASGSIGNFRIVVERKGAVKERNQTSSLSFEPFQGARPNSSTPPPSTEEIYAGSIVMATGFQHYTPNKGEFGFGDQPRVIPLPEFIRLLSSKGPLKVEGKPVRAVAFIHCVGSRQIPGIHEPGPNGRLNEYCSRVCCTATLQAANEIKERFPYINVHEFYRDIRTYGRGHEDYYERASRRGVLFFRFEPADPPVVESSSGEYPLKVRVKDTLTWGEEVEVEVDLVVLAVGMQPRGTEQIVEQLKIPIGDDGFLLEVHPKLRPVEVSVGGVVLAGTCQAPKDITESCASASAAAVKVSSILSKGYVELEPFVARVDPSLCDGCGKCLEDCGYEGALEIVETDGETGPVKRAIVHPPLCRGCGACAAVCPHRAISLAGWTLDQYEAMVDALVDSEAASGGGS